MRLNLRFWRRHPAAGRYVCASPKCGWAWTTDGRGAWKGPYFPEGESVVRTMTTEQVEYYYMDCWPRLRREC